MLMTLFYCVFFGAKLNCEVIFKGFFSPLLDIHVFFLVFET